jgi:hypothetical protein
MKRTIKITESDIRNIIKKVVEEQAMDRYMFWNNLKQIHRQTALLLEQNKDEIHNILENGHDWAQDHIATAKESIDQVFDFLMNESKGTHDECSDCGNEMMSADDSSTKYQALDMMEEGTKKNTPTNKKLWAKAKSIAKSKYKIWPSALASGFATKWYNSHGGKWSKK